MTEDFLGNSEFPLVNFSSFEGQMISVKNPFLFYEKVTHSTVAEISLGFDENVTLDGEIETTFTLNW